MRISSLLTAAAFAATLAGSNAAFAANFSGAPEQQTLLPGSPPAYRQLQNLQNQQTGPYDSPDFVVPPYNIFS